MKINQKMSILFWIWKDKKDSEERAPIYVRITIEGKRAQFSLGLKIKTALFNSKTGMAKGIAPEARKINSEINIITGRLQQYFNVLSIEHKFVTPDMLKNIFLEKNSPNKTVMTIIALHNQTFSEKVGAGYRANATLKKYNATKEKIRAFIKYEFGLQDIDLKEIKPSFADDLLHYLSVYEHLENNTIMKHIKNMKKIFMLAVNKEWIPVNPIANYKCTYKESTRERLNDEELNKLISAKFNRTALEEARDSYIAMCFTSYAYKDAFLLTPENIQVLNDGARWLVKNREKTDCKENVPILPIVEAIIDKYKEHPFCVAYNKILPIHSNQKLNSCLKDIASLCGIRKTLTTHTARHTFATTVTLGNGMPIETVCALLGHSSIKTTQIYAKVMNKKVSEDMQALKLKLQAKQ